MSGQKELKSKSTMIIVCLLLGGLGIHRLMMGYKNWWLMPLTAGGCYIWLLSDLIKLISGKMNMADGQPLT